MPIPPAWFGKSLAALDSLLSVRWGDAAKSWIIQRKSFVPESEVAFLVRNEARLRTLAFSPAKDAAQKKIYYDRQNWKSCAEELASARVGSRVIFTTDVLTDHVFKNLCQSDISGYGGYARFADTLEAEEDRAIAERERITENKQTALNGEMHSVLRFLHRKRGSLLDANETDLKFLLHGKRTSTDDGELMPLKEF